MKFNPKPNKLCSENLALQDNLPMEKQGHKQASVNYQLITESTEWKNKLFNYELYSGSRAF